MASIPLSPLQAQFKGRYTLCGFTKTIKVRLQLVRYVMLILVIETPKLITNNPLEVITRDFLPFSRGIS